MIPPTDTFNDCTGIGRFATAVPSAGAAPVAIDGDKAPAPVKYNEIIWPAEAVFVGTSAPFASVKIPGATFWVANVELVVCPLFMTCSDTVVLAGVSYGIWTFN